MLNNNDLQTLNKSINKISQAKIDNFHTIITGKVKNVSQFSPENSFFSYTNIVAVDVEPDGFQTKENGKEIAYPLLTDIPLFMMAGGLNSYIYTKITINSRVLVLFTEENSAGQINDLINDGSRKKIYERGSLSNAIAILMQPANVQPSPTTGAGIIFESGDEKMSFKNSNQDLFSIFNSSLVECLNQIVTVLNSLVGDASFSTPASTITPKITNYQTNLGEILE